MPTKEELGLVAQSDNTRVLNGRPFSTSSVNTTLYWDPQTQQFEKNLIQQFLHIRIIGYLNAKLAQHLED